MEKAAFCHKIRASKDDDKTISNLNQCHSRNFIFVKNSVPNFTSCFVIRDESFHLINNSIMMWLSFRLEESAIKMEYILNISLPRYFKNTAIFKLSHNALDIAWNVCKFHEARNNIWQKRSGLIKWELRVFYWSLCLRKHWFKKILLQDTCIHQNFDFANRRTEKDYINFHYKFV
jgi:hypothetical protein